MRLDSESGSTNSQTHGICACSLTPGVGWTCGSRSTVAKRCFTEPIQAFVVNRPWNIVIRATSNDRDFWKEELEDKVVDFRNVRQVVNKLGGKDRSRSRRRGGAKQERGRSGGFHHIRAPFWFIPVVVDGVSHCVFLLPSRFVPRRAEMPRARWVFDEELCRAMWQQVLRGRRLPSISAVAPATQSVSRRAASATATKCTASKSWSSSRPQSPSH